jgi:hypothetical protein
VRDSRETVAEVTRNRGEALAGRPAGQGFAGLGRSRQQRADSDALVENGQAASMSVGTPGGLRASTPLLARCLRIFPITRGSVMNAMIRICPPQREQMSGSTS